MIPGLPDRRNYGNLANLKPQQLYTLLRQLHNAKRSGKHIDVRIGSPTLGMFSWAAPKDLPKENEKRLLITQPLHTYAYKDFQGQIYSPYGRGTVKKLQQSPILMLQNKPDKIKFTRANRNNGPVYTMIKTRNNNWITTVRYPDASPIIKFYTKEHFKKIPIQQVADLLDKGAKVYPKVDGAGALAQIKPSSIEVYGLRKNKNGDLIRYTDHIGGLRDLNIPKQLVGKVFRAQVTGEEDNKPITANRLAGLLNSTLQNNIKQRVANNINLKLVALAMLSDKQDYDKNIVNSLVRKLNISKVQALPQIANREVFNKHLQLMRSNKHPITQQGFVIQEQNKRPVKAKLVQDKDVIIRRIFPAVTKTSPRAGGFQYSLPQSQEIVGRVGTGFTHQMLKDMLDNPDKYIGSIAKIRAMQQYPSGAYRSPSFIALRTEGD